MVQFPAAAPPPAPQPISSDDRPVIVSRTPSPVPKTVEKDVEMVDVASEEGDEWLVSKTVLTLESAGTSWADRLVREEEDALLGTDPVPSSSSVDSSRKPILAGM